MSNSEIHKKEFVEIGELIDTPEYGLVISLPFGKALKRVLKHLFGEKLEVGFKPLKYQRSAAQNRWLWGVAYICISRWYKETDGVTVSKEAIHAHNLQYILDYKIVQEDIDGKEVLVVKGKSTSQLNVQEFNDMKERLQAYWSEKGCDIPDPRENNFLSDYVTDK